MTRIAPSVLRRYLFGGQLPAGGCLRQPRYCPSAAPSLSAKRYHGTQAPDTSTDSALPETTIPFRKQLKDEAKKRKAEGTGKKSKQNNQKLENWELTVGIEVHAQLNTERKLFSAAASSINDVPNTHVAFFDVAMPGSQPKFQKETLIPALRAALALNCEIQTTSRFDRKHYFHWDQPAGYQITQYYEPFARDGYITLYAHDGIAAEDGEEVRIGIKQIQMEQDTAKTISQPGDVHLLDFNRVGLPLIEIITLPQIHHPSTAAALVRKTQILLNAVDACVLGIQSGGLRADVNVSVRRRNSSSSSPNSYGGVANLGQRTEIKNLSSFKAVEDAIIAERDRQIDVLESGGVIEGDTRGWTIGSTETKRLRGKEGEVDYRYMPDPDLAPVVIGDDLVTHLKTTLGILPDQEINILVEDYGLTTKDAMSLVSLNDGGTAEYFKNVVDKYLLLSPNEDLEKVGKLCGNWVLHEMGGLTHDLADEENPLQMTPDGSCLIPARDLADLLHYLSTDKITGRTAKKVLAELFVSGVYKRHDTAKGVIYREGWWFTPLSEAEYEGLAKEVLDANVKVVDEILAGKQGKVNFLVGQMMRGDQDGRVDASRAREVVMKLIDERRV
jgi:aspartyl-tRNA(Asn)/glutamyl-tRNA(Gln) amidotransferase subunit B